jgi:glycosyltransferase involved in cell wall biosynthesis
MADFLEPAIESVLSQDYTRIEYIVIDGGSSDGTRDLLDRYQGRLRYTSSPDNGPSDAIHRGFMQASGDILAWLNADDTYEPGALRAAVEYMTAHPEVDVAYGEGFWMDEAGRGIGPYPTMPFNPLALRTECFICQPAAFIRSEAYRKCNLDPALQLSFDYDLWIRMAAQNCRFAYIPKHLANTRMHSHSKTLGQRKPVFETSMQLLRRHYGYVPFSWVLAYASFRLDGRDQFFEPFRPSALKYFASLPLGLWYNPAKPFRYFGEWFSAGISGVLGRLRRAKPMLN